MPPELPEEERMFNRFEALIEGLGRLTAEELQRFYRIVLERSSRDTWEKATLFEMAKVYTNRRGLE